MKRSEINRRIGEAIRFFESMNFKPPPWAFWTPGQWQDHQGDHNEEPSRGCSCFTEEEAELNIVPFPGVFPGDKIYQVMKAQE